MISAALMALSGIVPFLCGLHDQPISSTHSGEGIAKICFSSNAKGVNILTDTLNIERSHPSDGIGNRCVNIRRAQRFCAADIHSWANGNAPINLHWQERSILLQGEWGREAFSHYPHLLRGRLAAILQSQLHDNTPVIWERADGALINSKIGSQLPLSRITSNPIRMKSKGKRDEDPSQTAYTDQPASPCPPRAIGSSVCGLPLGAQIGISAIIAGLAWFCLLVGAFRPFGLLVIGRRDLIKAVGYGLLSIGLFVVAFSIGMIGAS